jgi:hypothetical protein
MSTLGKFALTFLAATMLAQPVLAMDDYMGYPEPMQGIGITTIVLRPFPMFGDIPSPWNDKLARDACAVIPNSYIFITEGQFGCRWLSDKPVTPYYKPGHFKEWCVSQHGYINAKGMCTKLIKKPADLDGFYRITL